MIGGLLAAALASAEDRPAAGAGAAPVPEPVPADGFLAGISYADWARPDQVGRTLYDPAQVAVTLPELAETGATWIALVVSCTFDALDATSFRCEPPRTAPDDTLRRVVAEAHALGLRVMLKPELDPVDRRIGWRGALGSPFTTEAEWQAWFAGYTTFAERYATLSAEAGVDLLCVGVELGSTTHREQDWRAIVARVRELYPGPLTYAALPDGPPPPGSEQGRIRWWDALDYIGVDAYYPLATSDDPSVRQLTKAWKTRGYRDALAKLSATWDRPVLLTEVGFRSVDGAARAPASYRDRGRVDLGEQADLYEATFAALGDEAWLAGMFVWQWFASPAIGGPEDDTFTPRDKPAEEVLRRFYARKGKR